jgi:hypothetical protein
MKCVISGVKMLASGIYLFKMSMFPQSSLLDEELDLELCCTLKPYKSPINLGGIRRLTECGKDEPVPLFRNVNMKFDIEILFLE